MCYMRHSVVGDFLFGSGLVACVVFFAFMPCRAADVEDFTFIQVSDVHAPMAQSATTIARVKELRAIDLAPYKVNVPKPSFVLATGDLNEFGGGSGWWKEYMDYWKGCPFPLYQQLGNHDNTWHGNMQSLRLAGQKTYYSFDAHGCHFVGLMTPTPQDPRPSISEEQLVWLEADLEKVTKQKPVFVFFHHPLAGSEFASRYDCDRLLDVLRRYNTVLMMAGHSHGFVSRPVGGLDQVTGGSTFGGNAGFSVLSVKDGTLRVAYWKVSEPAPGVKLLEKKIPDEPALPVIEISSPAVREVAVADLRIYARLGSAKPDGKVTYTIDDRVSGELMVSGGGSEFRAMGRPSLIGLLPGAHYLRVELSSGGRALSRSTHFFYEPDQGRAAWRAYLGASSKVTPVVENGLVYVAGHDGVLRAFDAASGSAKWTLPCSAEILASPVVHGGKVIVADGTGKVTACDDAGKQLWNFQAANAVYSSPVVSGENVLFGCNDGVFYAVNAATGRLAWTNNDASYSIEAKPCLWRNKVYYGAWDQYVRCLDATTGKLLWKAKTEGVKSAKAAHRYYSPGDATPAVVDGRLMIADRNYMLTILDAETGAPIGAVSKVAAVSASADGQFAYLRGSDGRLAKINAAGKEVWSVPAGLNAIPTSPTEHNGVVYVCGSTGQLSAHSAADGKLQWQHSVSPGLFVMSSVACDSDRVYATAFDGSLTALRQGQ